MVLVFGRRALVGRGSSWWLGVVPECRVPWVIGHYVLLEG